MRHVLVTGGAGFIGTNFVYHWVQAHPSDRLVVLDALTYAGNKQSLEPLLEQKAITFVHGNICHPDLLGQVLLHYDIDTIVHFAAESHVDRSITDPLTFIQTNVVGTQTLLDAFLMRWQKLNRPGNHRFIHVSTDEVYGSLEGDAAPFVESSVYQPNNPYAASKAGGDHLVRAAVMTHGAPAIVTHCTNNYGPFQLAEKLIAKACVNLLQGKPIPIYGDGAQVRDWLWVGDHCLALDAIIHRGKPGELYNIGAECGLTNLEILRLLRVIVEERVPNRPVQDTQSLFHHVVDRPGHDRRYGLDASKLRNELGWEPQVALRAGLEQTVDWYVSQEPT